MWDVLAALLAGAIGLLALLYLTRGSVIRRARSLDEGEELPRIGSDDFTHSFQLLTGVRLQHGNTIELLVNGDHTYDRLAADVEGATSTLTWHTFWMKPGQLADRMHDLIVRRARAGVRVLFLRDYFGATGLETGYFDSLEAAGVEIAVFRPPSLRTFYKLQHRMHTRAVVIDRRIAYTGGFGIDDRWLGDGRSAGSWRDTNVRCEGPIVDHIQSAFLSNWAEATGDLIVGDGVYAGTAAIDGGSEAGVLRAAPSHGSTSAERHFVLLIVGAQRRLYLTNAYFVPGSGLRALLCEAVGRGVDVRVLTPGRNTDRKSTWYAGRAHYEQLLEAGVRIYEYGPSMVHAKTVVVDGEWVSIGTLNFDDRSMSLNDEIAVIARDRSIADRMESLFLEDLEHAAEVDLETIRRRGRASRLAERASVLVAPLL